MAEAELRILDSVKGKIEDYLEAQLHVGTAAVSARLAMLENTEMTGGQKQWSSFGWRSRCRWCPANDLSSGPTSPAPASPV